MTPRLARVRGRRREAPDVVTLDIELPGGGAGSAPGRFNMLTAFGVGEVPISFSETAGGDRLTHTVRGVGAVTRALAALEPGAALGVRGPFGAGWPMAETAGRDVVIVAGGIGLAPLRPVARALLGEAGRAERVCLLYGARSPRDLLFAEDLEAWDGRRGLDLQVTVDHAPAGWTGRAGVVTRLIPRAAFDPANAVAFVCGPEVMMRFAIAALREAGLPDAAIHLSMERNMKCAVGFCGHCQFGPDFVCRDGPVFRHDRVRARLGVKEL
jgi:NAD(P)H-flavin reductase